MGQPNYFTGSTDVSFRVGQRLTLDPAVQDFAGIVAAINNVDPAAQGRSNGGSPLNVARSKDGIPKAQISKLDLCPMPAWGDLGRIEAQHKVGIGIWTHIAHHCPGAPVEIDLPERRA